MGRVVAAILIGGLRRSDFESSVGERLACLPLDAEDTLLSAWASLVVDADGSEIRVVTSGGEESLLEREIDRIAARERGLPIRRIVEPGTHRGTAGVLRDTLSDLAETDEVLWIEPHCLPPATLRPLRAALESAPIAIGVAGEDDPAGVCAMRAGILERAAKVGYQDFKEQFLPAMAQLGERAAPVRLQSRGMRVHSRKTYLEATGARRGGPRIHPGAMVDPTATVCADSVVGADARIGPGAIVNASVVLPHAAIGEGAVVARSVVPWGRRVAPRSLLVDRVLDLETSDSADELVSLVGLRGGLR